ncbi:MAG: magnesium/cobalt transporter CorA [Ferruginibacter sp.]
MTPSINKASESTTVSPCPRIITLIEYDKDTFACYPINRIEETFKYLHTDAVSWINIDGISKETVEKIAVGFNFHILMVEDILSGNQRAKFEEINDRLFCVLNMISEDPASGKIQTEQISIVLGRGFVVSFQEECESDVFDALRSKLKSTGIKLRESGADFLFYTLIDTIVDHYFLVVERIAEKIVLLEESIVHTEDKRMPQKIGSLRNELIILKRNMAPVREMVSGLVRSESPLIEGRTRKYFRDVYDHIIQANELVENCRDMIVNAQDQYMNNINLRLNEAMRTMTVVTCLLAPATVIGGIFGMNFDIVPLKHDNWGFWISVVAMFTAPAVMLWVFKRKNWF